MPKPRKSAQSVAVWNDSPWITRRSAEEKKDTLQASGDAQRQNSAVQGQAETDEDLDEIHRCMSMLTIAQCHKSGELGGPCALVCKEDSSIAGYFFDSNSHTSWVGCGQDCQQDPDWRLLLVRLQSSENNEHIFTLVEKHGGDAFQLSAPEKSTLDILQLLTSKNVKAEMLMKMSFETSVLKALSDGKRIVRHEDATKFTLIHEIQGH